MAENNRQSRVLAALIERQRANGWTDQQMADELGILRAYWTQIRNGSLSLSFKMTLHAIRRFPDLIGQHTLDTQQQATELEVKPRKVGAA